MERLAWLDDYKTGHAITDAYHLIFFQMVEELRNVLAAGLAADARQRLDFLLDYVVMHFESEERLMEQMGYPNLEVHKAAHQAMKMQVLDLYDRLDQDANGVSPQELLTIFENWFREHIIAEDMQYKPYLHH